MYFIKKTQKEKLEIFDREWENANVADIAVINWKEFSYAPKTTAKILYNESGIWVQMQTDEQDLLARCTKQNGPVSDDSCMEFFFRPNENDPRYLNFEYNAFGTMYCAVRTGRFDSVKPKVDKKDFCVETYVEEGNWILQYFVPFSFIESIFGSYTKTMYANLYKIGVDTKFEHYVSYAPINADEPDFHRPECFVEFVLEDF